MFRILTLVFISLFAFTSISFALNSGQDYSVTSFEAAQEAGEMIIVEVYKEGCGTCASQKPALEQAQKLYPDAKFFRVNYVEDKEAVTKLKAIKQSTIIVFKGAEEKGRLVGETNATKILAEIQKGA